MRRLIAISALMVTGFCVAGEVPISGGQLEEFTATCGRYGPHAVDENGQIDFKSAGSQPGELPWTVRIISKSGISGVGNWLGALIHPQAVLVVAEPDYRLEPEDLVVRAGEWDLTAPDTVHPPQERAVARIASHERTLGWKTEFKFAILILSRPFELAENVGVVCLPREKNDYDAERCIASGWNRRSSVSNGTRLERVSTSIWREYQCYAAISFLSPQEWKLCVGKGSPHDMCMNDVGIPLICPLVSDPSRYVLAGLQMTNNACNNGFFSFRPSVFADVSQFRGWIDAQTLENSFDP